MNSLGALPGNKFAFQESFLEKRNDGKANCLMIPHPWGNSFPSRKPQEVAQAQDCEE
jgi:hypothetical protein